MLQRLLVLAAAIVLYIAAFTIYFDVTHAQMEGRFRDERKKFGVEGQILTATTPIDSAPAPGTLGSATPSPADASASSTPAPADTSTSTTPAAPDASASPASAPTPAPSSDSSATPGATASPSPDMSAPSPNGPAPSSDSNAAPATPAAPANPSSTRDDSGAARAPIIQFASYRPFGGVEVRFVSALMGQTAPATTATAAPAPMPTPSAATTTAPTAISSPAVSASTEGSVIVLLYHQFKAAGVPIPSKFQWTMNVDVFEAEMKYIHDNGYNVIPMSQLLAFLHHQGTVPPRAVVITIDDGYKSAIVYAAPVLKKYGYPWTFFIYPEFITVGEGPGAASWNDLLELQKEGIDIECHSMTHPILKSHKQRIKGVWHELSPDEYAAWLNNETAGAKAVLEQHMGKPITCFAYPYGEYNTQVEDATIAAGFDAIFTVADNPVHSTTSLHSIGRYTITQGVEKNFAAYLHQGALGLNNADPAPGATISDPRPVISATLGYLGTLDPKSIETSVRDFGDVRHDFDPATNTIRLYLPRDLVAPVVLVNIRVRDAATGQIMVANWHFNYEPGPGAASVHAPIATPGATPPSASNSTPAKSTAPAATAATAESEVEKSAAGTPLDKQPAASPAPAAAASAPAAAAAPASTHQTD